MVAGDLEYYKTKSQLLELQLNENRLVLEIERLRKQRENIFLSLGLDPSKNYKFTDSDCSIEEA